MLACVDRPELHSLYGRCAAPWLYDVPPLPEHTLALSWRPCGPNAILVHAGDGSAIARAVQILTAARVPGVLLVADSALGGAQQLIDAGWICIGRSALMRYPARSRLAAARSAGIDARQPTAVVRPLSDDRPIADMRKLLIDVFGFDTSPPPQPGTQVWGLLIGDTLVSCATTVTSGDTVGIWNVATLPAERGKGYASTLMTTIHREYEKNPDISQFLLATETSDHLYATLGYQTVEWWQEWSRPRWALGRV